MDRMSPLNDFVCMCARVCVCARGQGLAFLQLQKAELFSRVGSGFGI